MPIAVIALSTLALASQATAQLLYYTSPLATTVWTAGQLATVSWGNSCNEVVGNTTFPIYIQGPPAGMIPDPIGYLDCKMPGKSNVMVPATLPQGKEYWIWAMTKNVTSASSTFTILASISVSTSTILPTTTTILTTSGPANPTGSSPTVNNEGDDTKSNGAVIGGTVAAVVAVIAAVALLFFRRLRRQQQSQKVTNAPEAASPSNQFLPSMENPSEGPDNQESQHDKSLKQRPTHNPQYIPRRTPQDRPSIPQAQIYPLQKENAHSQFAPLNNPQLIPADAQDQSFTTLRSPQETHAPIPTDNSQDMQQQIHMLQTELNRLQARLDTKN
ncbi:hypothetical protein CPC16_006856 [Podila verticillata]|nr:hypothetical protein BGZ59_005122 [Podila verticillata]KAF9387806.1 hypothetical protein CPC16_006856 [Podila verticillata]